MTSQSPTSRQPLGLGFIGAGAFAGFLAGSLPTDQRIVGVHDPGPASLPEEFRGARRASSLRELVTAPDVDIVIVATPPSVRVEPVLAALQAGKPVFVEKPLALTLAQADTIVSEAERCNRAVAVDHVLRFSPIYRALLRLARDVDGCSPLGRLRRYAFENDAADEDLPPAHWFWNRASSGGIGVEHGIHFIDGARILLDELPSTLTALQSSYVHAPAVDTWSAAATYPSGATASWYHSFTHLHRAESQLTRLDYGTAKAVIEGWIPVRAILDVWTDDQGTEVLRYWRQRPAELLAVPGFRLPAETRVELFAVPHGLPGSVHTSSGTHRVSRHLRMIIDLGGEKAKTELYREGVRAALTDLARAIRGGQPVACDPATARDALAVALAAQASADSGSVVGFPPPPSMDHDLDADTA